MNTHLESPEKIGHLQDLRIRESTDVNNVCLRAIQIHNLHLIRIHVLVVNCRVLPPFRAVIKLSRDWDVQVRRFIRFIPRAFRVFFLTLRSGLSQRTQNTMCSTIPILNRQHAHTSGMAGGLLADTAAGVPGFPVADAIAGSLLLELFGFPAVGFMVEATDCAVITLEIALEHSTGKGRNDWSATGTSTASRVACGFVRFQTRFACGGAGFAGLW
jgi:hypothetical protein